MRWGKRKGEETGRTRERGALAGTEAGGGSERGGGGGEHTWSAETLARATRCEARAASVEKGMLLTSVEEVVERDKQRGTARGIGGVEP